MIKEVYKTTAVYILNFFLISLVFIAILELAVFVSKKYIYSVPDVHSKIVEKKLISQAYSEITESERKALLAEWDNWERPYDFSPYVMFKEKTRKGRFINVSSHGFRKSSDQDAWPLDKERLNIFMFGGSTTFGYRVRDFDTIAAHLKEIFTEKNVKVNIYNFGRAGYYSTQERVLFENLLIKDAVPDIAIFLDGLNDFYNNNNQPMYSDRMSALFNSSFLGRMKIDFATHNPISRIVRMKKHSTLQIEKKEYWENPQKRRKKFNDKKVLKKVIQTYLKNIQIIEEVSKKFRVKAFFFWQPIPHYNGDIKHAPFYEKLPLEHIYSEYGYKLLREMIDRKKVILTERFSWLADLKMEGVSYVDPAHYSSKFSNLIARDIHEKISPLVLK